MARVLFLFPLFHQAHSLSRFHNSIEKEKTNHIIDFVITCSNNAIYETASSISSKLDLKVHLRPNYGGGEGILFWTQQNIFLDKYDYIWYFEESCNPIKQNWINRLISQMEFGSPITGWDWNPFAKKRKASTRVTYKYKNRIMCANINSDKSGRDSNGYSYAGTWDTPGYKHENFIIHKNDFVDFKFDDPSIEFYNKDLNPRYYGIRSERFWWDNHHYFYRELGAKCPNIQWSILTQNNFIPSNLNINKNYFQEILFKA